MRCAAADGADHQQRHHRDAQQKKAHDQHILLKRPARFHQSNKRALFRVDDQRRFSWDRRNVLLHARRIPCSRLSDDWRAACGAADRVVCMRLRVNAILTPSLTLAWEPVINSLQRVANESSTKRQVLRIGVECGLTNGVRLSARYFGGHVMKGFKAVRQTLQCMLLATVFLPCSENACAVIIDFDDFSTGGGGTGFAAADRYRSQGIVFAAGIPIDNVAIIEPAYYPTFLVQGGTSSNAMSLSLQTIGVLSIDAYFVIPNTSTPGVTDLVRIRGFDTGVGSILGTLVAFDINDVLIATQTLITPPSQSAVLEVSVPGIARVRFSTDADGAYFDNLIFNAPTVVPEPSTFSLLVLGTTLIALCARKSRRGHGHRA